MLKTPVYIVLLLLLSGACNEMAGPGPGSGADTSSSSTGLNTPASPGMPKDGPKDPDDSVIVLRAQQNDTVFIADIQKDYQQIHVQIPVTHTRHLNLQLQPEGKDRNLRISQVQMPDGKTDGPFGLIMEYPTKKPGVYMLIIGRNNMADGRVKGPVRIVVARQ
ncbi:hypothetical protein [Niabella hirudinis]|uniref:hypothetical protein n=1 Tax=Niabella hirudinis TaxID=1285929 RepID=UPI003EBBE5F6